MAGARASQRGRGQYTTAGYVHNQPSLYIADMPAGSPQENLRDLNRRGYGQAGSYRSDRPWRDTPQPLFNGNMSSSAAASGAAVMGERAATQRARAYRARREDFSEMILRVAMQEKREVIVCVVLLVAIMMIVASWGQKMVEGVRIQNSIAEYQALTIQLEKQSESFERQLELAKGGERIRNLAQNELGMLRPERAQKQSVYIQSVDLNARVQQEQAQEPSMELLDILLGLLSVFHIGE